MEVDLLAAPQEHDEAEGHDGESGVERRCPVICRQTSPFVVPYGIVACADRHLRPGKDQQRHPSTCPSLRAEPFSARQVRHRKVPLLLELDVDLLGLIGELRGLRCRLWFWLGLRFIGFNLFGAAWLDDELPCLLCQGY